LGLVVVDDPFKVPSKTLLSLEHSFVRVKLFLALRLSGRPQGPADMASFKRRGGTFPSLAPILGIFVEVLSRTMSNLRITLPVSATAEINSRLYCFEETHYDHYS
jgi:hypothetical protein